MSCSIPWTVRRAYELLISTHLWECTERTYILRVQVYEVLHTKTAGGLKLGLTRPKPGPKPGLHPGLNEAWSRKRRRLTKYNEG